MRDLYIRNFSPAGDSASNKRHFRNIYFLTVGDFYYQSLNDRMAKTTHTRKVIHLQRKYEDAL